MSYHSPEFAAKNMRGQFSLAYEAVMAARFLNIIISREQAANKDNPQKQAGRIAVLAAAKAMLEDYADQHVLAALDAREDMTALRAGQDE